MVPTAANLGEATGFKLPVNGRVWTQPYSKVGIWAPAYENDYVNGVPVGTPAPAVEGWSLPLLCQTGNLWVLVTETGLEPSYFGVHLEQRADDGLYRVRLPEVPETYGVAPQAASITLRGFTLARDHRGQSSRGSSNPHSSPTSPVQVS